MSDMENLRKGFEILARYDNTQGDVSCDENGGIYAGPQHDDVQPGGGVSADDRERLMELGWEYDSDVILRWGYW